MKRRRRKVALKGKERRVGHLRSSVSVPGQMLLVLVNNQSKEAKTQGPHARRATAEMRSPSMAGGLPGQKGYSTRLLHRVTATWCTQVRKEPVKLPQIPELGNF